MKTVIKILRFLAQTLGGVLCVGVCIYMAEQLRITNEPVYLLGIVVPCLLLPAYVD